MTPFELEFKEVDRLSNGDLRQFYGIWEKGIEGNGKKKSGESRQICLRFWLVSEDTKLDF